VTDQDLVAALKNNKLHIDCVCMELTQNTESSPIRHTGLGYIFQDEGEIICFRMYVNRSQNFSMRAHLSQSFSGTPGTLYREQRYYDLSAKSYEGDRWQAQRIDPSVSWFDNGLLISGKIYMISRS
jgi:hypothetical protein